MSRACTRPRLAGRRGIRALAGALIFAAALSTRAAAANEERAPLDGRAILERQCAACHNLDKTGASPFPKAPPLRDVYRRYPIEKLEFEFAEGMGSSHPDMPQVQFSTEEVGAILDYLARLSDAK